MRAAGKPLTSSFTGPLSSGLGLDALRKETWSPLDPSVFSNSFQEKNTPVSSAHFTFVILVSFHVPEAGLELANIAENGIELLILLPLPLM